MCSSRTSRTTVCRSSTAKARSCGPGARWGAEPGQLFTPIGLQLGPAGNVWVVDSGNERVQVFTQHGELLRVFDNVGPGPQIISLNAAGEFYISSPQGNRVRKFSPDGALLAYLGLSATAEELGRMTNEEAAIYLELALPLRGPHGTVTDPSGAVYVAETGGGPCASSCLLRSDTCLCSTSQRSVGGIRPPRRSRSV